MDDLRRRRLHLPGKQHWPVPSAPRVRPHLCDLAGEHTRGALTELLSKIVGLRWQEDEKQTRFKISYYCDAEAPDELVTNISNELDRTSARYRIISSIDPFTGDGLIDLLPSGVSKVYALRCWATHPSSDQAAIIFAGDSGKDIAALTAGYRSIVVGNATDLAVKEIQRMHRSAGWTTDRLVISTSHATSGVLEGLQSFLRFLALHLPR